MRHAPSLRLIWTVAALFLIAVAMACTPRSRPQACAGHGTSPDQNWSIAARINLPEGADLAPDDPAKPGEAGVQALTLIGGRVFAAYTNLFDGIPAGPSWISIHDGTTLAQQTMLKLEEGTGAALQRCTNAGSVRAMGDTLLVACAGSVSLTPGTTTNDGMLVELSASQGAITQFIPTGHSPGAIAVSGSNIWLADLESPTLLRVDAGTGAVLNGQGGAAPLPICSQPTDGLSFASDLIVVNGRGFASCLNDDTVQEFNPSTGALVGPPLQVGATPVRLANINGELVVLNSTEGTASLISLATTPATVEPCSAYVAGAQGSTDIEDIDGDSTIAAVTDPYFGTLAVLDMTNAFQVVASVDLKNSATGGSNDPYGVVLNNGAFYVSISGFGNPPAELVRVARQP